MDFRKTETIESTSTAILNAYRKIICDLNTTFFCNEVVAPFMGVLENLTANCINICLNIDV